MENSARCWVENLRLQPHPEGGFYREIYRSEGIIPKVALDRRFSGDRAFATSIYYLLAAGDFSAFHRILSDETWHFYAGGSLDLYILSGTTCSVITLGSSPNHGQHLQYTVPAHTWFAARPSPSTPYSLLGCCVSPGFDFADFEMGERSVLCKAFPDSTETITSLTRL